MKKTNFRVICLVMALTLAFALILSGCSGKETPAEMSLPEENAPAEDTVEATTEPTAEPAPTSTPLPSASSSDVELYLGEESGSIVNAYGQPAEGYTLDKEGNILDSNNEFVVAAANTAPFTVYKRISFDKMTYSATLYAKEVPVGDDPNVTHVVQNPVNITVKIALDPADATNKVIVLSIADDSIAGFALNNANAEILAENFEPEAGKIAVCPKEGEKSISIVLTAKSRGETKIFADAVAGDASDVCSITVTTGTPESTAPEEPKNEFVIASLDDQVHHVHTYTKEIIEPTIYSGGYTLNTCTICGHSYTDGYTSKLQPQSGDPAPHVHTYVSSIVPPTATEGGYTQHTCTGCGDTYKDSFTDPLGETP